MLGSKGVGELGICGAAVANAVYNACGVRMRDYPITVDKLLPHLARLRPLKMANMPYESMGYTHRQFVWRRLAWAHPAGMPVVSLTRWTSTKCPSMSISFRQQGSWVSFQ